MGLVVLLVEDERELRVTLRDLLLLEGFTVHACASLADARAVFQHTGADGGIDIVLLDLGLPDGEGEMLLAEIRARRTTPVIILSARHLEHQKVRLLDAGADDYLVKPFSFKELLARMRVSMRHHGVALQPVTLRYRYGDVVVDLQARQVTKAGSAVHLTPKEYGLLARLVRSAGKVVTQRQLLADVWGSEFTEHTHYLRLFMGQLRAKLETTPADPAMLLTESGVGYRLVEGDDGEGAHHP
ncbi:response regulator [Lampropedia puyangensis]|uniref:Response regulator n=1 Tax=Lampropedia puyangensis TaxID=1330072 RepID=A0A4S8FAG2_9BURK|nr:response regulator [Lampropedia puyangensis]THU02572.1 response regulator [Lampropedia puyangensis]